MSPPVRNGRLIWGSGGIPCPNSLTTKKGPFDHILENSGGLTIQSIAIVIPQGPRIQTHKHYKYLNGKVEEQSHSDTKTQIHRAYHP